MICPRCGVINLPERERCSRCSGSLAPPPRRQGQPPPAVVPLTRRAELAQLDGAGGLPGTRRAELAPSGGGPLYVLATERSGQPPPPSPSPAEQVAPLGEQRTAMVVVGLSGA